MITFVELQCRELDSARAKHKPINSAHEGYSLILEEMDEFWEEVRKKKERRNPDMAVAELIQIAVMAQRTAEDVFMRHSQAMEAVVQGYNGEGNHVFLDFEQFDLHPGDRVRVVKI